MKFLSLKKKKHALDGQGTTILHPQTSSRSSGLDRSVCVANEPRGQGENVWYIDLNWQRVLSCNGLRILSYYGRLDEDRGSATKRLAPELSDKGNYGPYLGLWTSSETLFIHVRVQRLRGCVLHFSSYFLAQFTHTTIFPSISD